MKKVALVVMLLTASSFGAAIIAPAQVDVSSGAATITIQMVNDLNTDPAGNGQGLFGYSLKGVCPAGIVTITGRTNNVAADGITDATTVDASVVGKDLSTVADLGFTGVPFSTSVTRNGDLLTLAISVPNKGIPNTLIQWQGTLVDTFLSEWPVQASTLLVPEPISALLLGLGSLFFARRRRA